MLENQILECLELGPKTRAELARWCGWVTPGYAKNHPFRRAIDALVSNGKVSKKGKYKLTSYQLEANKVSEMDKSAISFSGRLSEAMKGAFLRLKREFPHLHSKCSDVVITVRNGEIQLQDFSDELDYEDIKFLKEFLAPHILEGEDAEKEEGLEDGPGISEKKACVIRPMDHLDVFMHELLGDHAKLVQ